MFEIMNKEKNIIVGPKGGDLGSFYKGFGKDYPGLLQKNVIVDLRNMTINKISEILVFLNTAKAHLEAGTSFVLIVKGIDVDELPDELVTVPTMVEAMDVIEMDEIARDLGF